MYIIIMFLRVAQNQGIYVWRDIAWNELDVNDIYFIYGRQVTYKCVKLVIEAIVFPWLLSWNEDQ